MGSKLDFLFVIILLHYYIIKRINNNNINNETRTSNQHPSADLRIILGNNNTKRFCVI